MKKGKIAAQAAHASLAAAMKASTKIRKQWEEEGMKKIVLKVSSKEQLLKLFQKAKRAKLPCELIIDRGLTQIKPGTLTALGIGPDKDEKIDKLTGKLKLL